MNGTHPSDRGGNAIRDGGPRASTVQLLMNYNPTADEAISMRCWRQGYRRAIQDKLAHRHGIRSDVQRRKGVAGGRQTNDGGCSTLAEIMRPPKSMASLYDRISAAPQWMRSLGLSAWNALPAWAANTSRAWKKQSQNAEWPASTLKDNAMICWAT